MHSNFIFPTVTEALPSLLTHLHLDGTEIGSRAGRTQEMTHVGITLTEPLDREILCDHRKANLAAQIAETMWVLSGRDDIAWLENYLPRVRDFSDDGKTWRAGYGRRLRAWEDHGHPKTVDQWRWLVEHLTEQPASRRAVMSIWDPVIDTEDGKDIPCNDWLSFLSRNGYLDLHVAIRSNDVIWGWSGINQFEWSALLEITAGMLGMRPGCLHFSTTSFHLYDRHFAKAERIRTQTLTNLDHLHASPRFDANVVGRDFDRLENLFSHWFGLEYDIRTGSPLVQGYVDAFPEPMLRSWLRILQWWWSEGVRSGEYLEPLKGTRLHEATRFAMQPKRREPKDDGPKPGVKPVDVAEDPAPAEIEPTPFILATCSLHNEKHEAYGDSWKKRGEMLGIMANVARKVDRLGKAETTDETSADTAADLMVYLAKYRVWIDEQTDGPIFQNWGGTDTTGAANEVLLELDRRGQSEKWLEQFVENEGLENNLRVRFDNLEQAVVAGDQDAKIKIVNTMLMEAYGLARRLSDGLDEYRGADVD